MLFMEFLFQKTTSSLAVSLKMPVTAPRRQQKVVEWLPKDILQHCNYIFVNITTLSLLNRGEHEVLGEQPVHHEGQKGWKHGWVCFPLLWGQQVQVLDLQSKVGQVFIEYYSTSVPFLS